MNTPTEQGKAGEIRLRAPTRCEEPGATALDRLLDPSAWKPAEPSPLLIGPHWTRPLPLAERYLDECRSELRRLRAERADGDGLTLNALRRANRARLPQFKNRKGEPAHDRPDGSDWKLSAWSNAVCGELGEAANLIKKIERGDVTLDEARTDLGHEFADVLTYLDILAFQAGIDLGEATARKFNIVSERVGSDVRLRASPGQAGGEERS